MRRSKPFYKKSHKAWYVQLNGRQVRLGTDKEEAFIEYHRLMAGELPVTSKTTVVEIITQFLDWVKSNRAAATHEFYKKYLAKSPKTATKRRSLLDYLPASTRVSDLKPIMVNRWIDDRYKGMSDNYKHCACRAIATCFNWATDLQILTANPVKGFKRPAATPRDCCLTPDQWQQLIGAVAVDDPFADLLWFMHDSGARPQEARKVTAAHFNGTRLIFGRAESKGGKDRRVIRLNERALAIVQRLAIKNPEGPIFRNVRGVPWTVYAMGCRFAKLRKQLGFYCCPYAMRHTWVTNALLRGVDPLVVAELAGHRDAAMIMKVYSHLTGNDAHLDAKLRQATGEDAA